MKDSKSKGVRFQILPLGHVYFLGISAEPSNALFREIIHKLPAKRIWFCGYLEDVYGYLPTKKQLTEGGYEAIGFQNSFDCGELVGEGVDKVSQILINYFQYSTEN